MAVADAVGAKVTADGGVNQAIMKAQLDKLLVEIWTEICAGSQNMHQSNLGTEDSIEVDTTVCIPKVFQFHYKDAKVICIFGVCMNLLHSLKKSAVGTAGGSGFAEH
jgi:hypothetical protein